MYRNVSSTVYLTNCHKIVISLYNFHTPDLSEDHHVVREHPIYTLL